MKIVKVKKMSIKTLTKIVEIEPEFLNKNIKEYIIEKLNKTIKNTCNKKDGYILEIHKIKRIRNGKISNITGNSVLEITFDALNIKPIVGQKLDCLVVMIFQHGIFAEKEKLKILVPMTTIKNYRFNREKSCLENRNKKIIEKDKKICIEITETRYESGQYSCIGVLSS